MKDNNPESIHLGTRRQWRTWLQKNHNKTDSVWLICYKKQSNKPTIPWSDAVSEALCFGWIDGRRKSIDDDKFIQHFSRRKPKGTWSKINKQKILQLIEEGLMTQAGLDTIEAAKQNGSWSILDEVEELIIPADLEKAFRKKSAAKQFFLNLSRSDKRAALQWLVLAKREETRAKRISEIVASASGRLKPPPAR